MKRAELNFAQKVWLESLWLGARFFAVLPYWFKYYVVENLLFFILYYCLRYRMKVVNENLRNSFPEKSVGELAVIRRNFYRTLAEIFVDTVNMAHMGEEKARTVLTVKGFDEHYKAVHGRDWIAMTAHFGCWEYCSYWGLYERSQMLVAVYHPLRSKVMERLYQRLRNYENSMTVAMKDSLRFYLRNRECGVDGKNLVMGLIADQNPPRRPDSHWFRFLNQDTIFFDGGETLAHEEPATGQELSVKEIQKQVLRTPAVWILAAASAFMYISRYAINGWGVLFLQEAKGFSDAQAISIVSINALLGIIGTVLSGWFSDKLFKGNRHMPALIFGILNSVALILFIYGGDALWVNVLSMVLFGIAIGVLICFLGGLMAVDIVPRKATGAALGVVGVASYIAAGLQDVASGWLIDANITVAENGEKIYDFSQAAIFWIAASVISFLLPLLNRKKKQAA